MSKKAIGAYLKRLRERRDFKQEDVAAAGGLDASSLSKFEKGKNNPNWASLVQMVRFLGGNLEDLPRLAPEEAPAELGTELANRWCDDHPLTPPTEQQIEAILQNANIPVSERARLIAALDQLKRQG